MIDLLVVKLIVYIFIFIHRYSYYICRSRDTPARTHLEGLALVLRLKVQIYVGPKIIKVFCQFLSNTTNLSVEFYRWDTRRESSALAYPEM